MGSILEQTSAVERKVWPREVEERIKINGTHESQLLSYFLPSLLDAHISLSSIKWVAGGIFMWLNEKSKAAKWVIASCTLAGVILQWGNCVDRTGFPIRHPGKFSFSWSIQDAIVVRKGQKKCQGQREEVLIIFSFLFL